MKAYVIKNKEGRYLQFFDADNDDIGFTDDLTLAILYNKNEKDMMEKAYSNMEWEYVEVTIAETEDLELDIKLDNAFWKQECDSLQETLKEKYKEIELLKMSVSFEQEHKNKALDELKQIRKQVCEQFKKSIIAESCLDTEEEARYWSDDIDVKTILEIIDKIEQGEQQ